MIIACDDLLLELSDYCKELEKEHKIMELRVIRNWTIVEQMAKEA